MKNKLYLSLIALPLASLATCLYVLGADMGIFPHVPSNIIYGLRSGRGLSVTADGNPNIPILTNTGVITFQGRSGDVSLLGSSGIGVNGIQLLNLDKGSAQKIFKTIKVGATSVTANTNTDTLVLGAGTGISLGTDASSKTITITNANPTQWNFNNSDIYYSSGNVGVGTAPSYTFDVNGGSTVSARFSGRVIGGNAVNANEFATLGQITSGAGSYWQRNSGALSPTTTTDDLLIAGSSTQSALFQVFGTGTNAGTASSSSNLVFTGSSTKISQLNGNGLTFQVSPGGDTGLTTAMFIQNNGNVGVGLTNPSGKMEIKAAVGTTNLVLSTPTVGNSLSLSHNDTNGIINSTLGGIQFQDSGVAKVTIDGTGNVGIGTTNPLTTLQVFGNASESGNLTFYGNGTAHTLNYLQAGTLNFQRSPGGDGGLTSTMFLDAAGNVGIGTTSPAGSLDVLNGDTGSSFFRRSSGNSGENISISDNSTGNVILGSSQNGSSLTKPFVIASDVNSTGIQFVTNTTNGAATNLSAYFDNFLHAIIGGSTSNLGNAALVVVQQNKSGSGDIFSASTSGTMKFTIGNGGTATVAGNFAFFGTNPTITTTSMNPLTIGDANTGPIQLSPKNTTGLYVNGVGNVGIGTTNPTFKLDVSGTGRFITTSTPQLTIDDNQASGQSYIAYYDNGTQKWQAGKNTDQSFFVYDTAGGRLDMSIFSNNGNMALMQAGGNVGIGTSGPAATFDVINGDTGSSIFRRSVGNAGENISISDNATGNVVLGSSVGGLSKNFILASDVNSGGISFVTNTTNGAGTALSAFFDNFQHAIIGGPSTSLGNAGLVVVQQNLSGSGDILTASSSGITRFDVTNNGNTGIGTTVPGTTLEARGTSADFGSSGGIFQISTAGAPNSLRFGVNDGNYNWIQTGSIALKINPNGGFTVLNAVNGQTGIGQSTPGWKLHVTDSQQSTASAMIENTFANNNVNHTGLIIRLGAANSGTNATLSDRFINFMRGDSTIVGSINGNGTGGINYNTGGVDFAEYFTKAPNQTFEEGDVVTLNGILDNQLASKSTTSYDSHLLGVVSAHPGFSGGTPGDDKVLVGLTGQVPVKVSTENGNILPGDLLTSSATFPGVTMKATKQGQVVAKALQGYSGSSVGIIQAYVSSSYADPTGQLASGPTPTPMSVLAASTTSSPLSLASLSVDGLATVSGDLRVKGNGLIEGILSVIDTLTTNNFIVNGISDFFAQVIFHQNVSFEGRPTFNQDTAGLAVIKQGASSVDIKFKKQYEQTPLVNVTIRVDQDSTASQAAVEQEILHGAITYVLSNVTTNGFTIKINSTAPSDITFSWSALSVKDATTSISGNANNPSPFPTVNSIPSVSPTIQPTPTPLPSVTPTSIPTITPPISP